MILCVGALMEVVSLILIPFIMSYGRSPTLFSLGREFGKQRFPKGWLFAVNSSP